MDTTLIYRKTPEGETALSGRSRLPDQRLRAVLILVDGETAVGALCAKFDDKFQADEKLARLEELGLIEPAQPAKPSSPEQVEAPPAEAAATQTQGAPQGDFPDTRWMEDIEPLPTLPEVLDVPEEPAAAPAQVPPTDPQPAEVETITVEDIPEWPEYPAAKVAPAQREKVAPLPQADDELQFKEEGLYPEFAQYDSPEARLAPRAEPPEESRLAKGLANWRERRKQRPGRAEKAAPAPRKKVANPVASPRPVRRSPLKLWLGVPAALLAAGALGVLFGVPWEKFRTEAEARASHLVGQPVHIGALGLGFLPYPHVVLSNVSVGSEPVARAAHVRLNPVFHDLGDGRSLALEVVVDNAALENEAVGSLCAATRLDAAAARQQRLRSIRFAALELGLPGTRIEGLNGEIALEAGRDTPSVTLADASGTLHLELQADAVGCRFTAESANWVFPVGTGIGLAGLNARGSVDAKGGRVERFDARSADGVVAGSGSLSWAQGARLELKLDMDHLRLEKALALVGRPAVARGEVDGKLRLTASAATLQELGKTLAGSGTVAVKQGAVDRFNVVEATRNPGKTAVYGGAFEFDRLSAELQFGRGTAALRAVSANAGALQVGGDVAIDNKDGMKGSLHTQVSSGARTLRVPLAVGGSLASPELSAPAHKMAAAPTAAKLAEAASAEPKE